MRRSWIGVLLAGVLLACGGKSGSSSGAGGGAKTSGPVALVASSVTKTQAAGSTKAAVTIVYDSLPAVNGPVTIAGTGEFNLKDRLGHLHLDLSPLLKQAQATQPQLPPNAGDVDIVFAGSVFYMKAPAFSALQPGLKPWLKIDAEKLAASGGSGLSQLQQLGGGSDPSQQLALLKAASEVKVVGNDTVRGVATTHYSATIDFTRVKNLGADEKKTVGALQTQTGAKSIPVDVWLDAQSRARRFTMKLTTKSANPAVTFTTTVEYFDFGVPVTVTVPQAGEVTDLSNIGGQPAPTSTSSR